MVVQRYTYGEKLRMLFTSFLLASYYGNAIATFHCGELYNKIRCFNYIGKCKVGVLDIVITINGMDLYIAS